MKEQSKLYKINVPIEQLYKNEDLPEEFYEGYKIYDQSPEMKVVNQGKIGFSLQVIDLSFIADSRTIYKDGWANYYIRASEECKEMNSELRGLQIGETHSMVTTITGKCFAWGYNDHGQLLSNDKDIIYHSFKLLKQDVKCENIVSGSDHVYVIDKDQNIYGYGRNDQGQLGLGHNRDVDDLVKLEALTQAKVGSIVTKGKQNFGITVFGECLHWPQNPDEGLYNPVQLVVPNRDKIKSVSCSYNYSMLLTVNGHLFAMGSQNSNGELGLGHTYPVSTPQEIGILSQERTLVVSCGLNHCMALTKCFKVYTWGKGSQGQLGTGDYEDRHNPTQVKIRGEKQLLEKARQIAAGPGQSMVQTEEASVFWWGNNSRIKRRNKPLKLDLVTFMDVENKNNAEQNEKFAPVKIDIQWSKTLSVASQLIADLRHMDDVSLHKKLLHVRTLLKEIADKDDCYDVPYNKIYAPYMASKDIETPLPKTYKKEFNLPFEKVQRVENYRVPDSYVSQPAQNGANNIPKESVPRELFDQMDKDSQDRSRLYKSPNVKGSVARTPRKSLKASSQLRGERSDLSHRQDTKMSSRSPMRDIYRKGSPYNQASAKRYTNLQESPARVLGLTSPNRSKLSNKKLSGVMEESQFSGVTSQVRFKGDTIKQSPYEKKASELKPIELLNEARNKDAVHVHKLVVKEEKTLEEMYPLDDLHAIKQKMKELLLKPRRMWEDNDKYLYEAASKRPLKDLLAKIK